MRQSAVHLSATLGAVCFLSTLVLSASAAWDEDRGCLTCHEGIERFSETPEMGDLSCTQCHQGNGAEKADRATAHRDMYANPTDLRVVDETCGVCHEDDVKNIKRSLHATMAGMIASTRYGFGAQDRKAIYATYAVKGGSVDRPGVVADLKQLPKYDPSHPEGPENSPADDYLRNQCLRCHLWNDGAQSEGDYRASGCAACHVLYSDAGVYEGGDKAIDKTQKDRPRLHKLTSKIPVDQCLHCHNRGGRTGVSFIGAMESDNYGSPFKPDGGKQGALHGKQYNHLTADIHYRKGLACVDCHSKHDLHGDGHIHDMKEQAVEIRCETCHGAIAEKAFFLTAHGNRLTNIVETNGAVMLRAKLSGRLHSIPQLKGAKLSEEGHAAMVAIPTHMEKLECYACHARWAPQCYGCHTSQDVGKRSRDWIEAGDTEDPSKAGRMESVKKTAFAWEESRSYLRWETPVLGINHRGKVSPFITGCQVIHTQTDSVSKTTMMNNKVFTTVHGTSGIMHNQIQPHTISRESRSCADCHMSRKALGIGDGLYDIRANFPDGGGPDFELERIVDEDGRQIQGTAHEGSRPFNKAEQQRIGRVSTCLACHPSGDSSVGNKAPTDKLHIEAIRSGRHATNAPQ